MDLEGIEKSLREGCRLHGFRSGGGLRVIRIEQDGKLRGYGEHPNVGDALSHANEDFLAGGKKYSEVYGKTKPHYLTGTNASSSRLDNWILRGHTIDAYVKNENLVVELRGLVRTDAPEEIKKKVKETGIPAIWKDNRGYVFGLARSEHGYKMEILETPENSKNGEAWMYYVVKTGKNNNFFKALEDALQAEEIETD